MSVMIETSVGTLVIDLQSDRCPLTTKNFLKLCKMKYYNHCLFHSVQKDFIAQTGDPTGKGTGGDSIYKFLYGDQARFFTDEIHEDLKHSKIGTVAMASAGENLNASQFYITLRDELDYLDGKHTVFGEVAEGFDTLTRINESFVDEKGRPYKNIRIKHTYILDDPFDDPPQLADLIPESSPGPRPLEEGEEVRLEDDWVPMDEQIDPEELEKSLRQKEAHSRAVVLEMIGDIPEAEVKPPENVLFVCKLNPVTQEEDLDVLFSRFGKVVSADIIKDYKTGDSLCYAFIEFEDEQACERAYFAMDNVLIDDRRIHVDFSQSVSKLWNQYNRTGKRPGDQGQGRKNGCFKCGEIGHIAKECPKDMDDEGINTTEQKPKYVLKDTNKQLGDTGKRYDMVFEEDVVNNSQTKHQHDKYASKKDTDARQGKKDSRRGRNERYEHDYTERSRHSKNTSSSRDAKNSQDRDSTDSRYFDKHHSSSKHRYHDHREADRYIGDGDKHRDRHGRDRYREEEKEKKRHRHRSVEESDCEDEKVHQKRRLQKDIRTHDSNGRVISRHEREKK